MWRYVLRVIVFRAAETLLLHTPYVAASFARGARNNERSEIIFAVV